MNSEGRDLKCEIIHISWKRKNNDGEKKSASLKIVLSSREMGWKGIRKVFKQHLKWIYLVLFLFFKSKFY